MSADTPLWLTDLYAPYGMMAKEDADVFMPLLDSVSNPVLAVRHPDGLAGAVRKAYW